MSTSALACSSLLSARRRVWLLDMTAALILAALVIRGPTATPWPFERIAVVSLKNASMLAEVDQALRRLGPLDLVIWPESMLTLDRGAMPSGTFAGRSGYDVTGALRRDEDGDRNVVAALREGVLVATRAKRWFAPYESGYVRGGDEVSLDLGGHRVMALICFEALGRRAAAGAGGGLEAIVVVASDRPLRGDPTARLHMERAVALLSAVHGLPVLRASTGGEASVALPGAPVLSTQRGAGRYSILVVERR